MVFPLSPQKLNIGLIALEGRQKQAPRQFLKNESGGKNKNCVSASTDLENFFQVFVSTPVVEAT